MDMEMLTLTYANADDLFADLRSFGLAGDNGEIKEIETLRHDERLAVTIEIVQGHAWIADAQPGAARRRSRRTLAQGYSVTEPVPRDRTPRSTGSSGPLHLLGIVIG